MRPAEWTVSNQDRKLKEGAWQGPIAKQCHAGAKFKWGLAQQSTATPLWTIAMLVSTAEYNRQPWKGRTEPLRFQRQCCKRGARTVYISVKLRESYDSVAVACSCTK